VDDGGYLTRRHERTLGTEDILLIDKQSGLTLAVKSIHATDGVIYSLRAS